MRLTPQVLRNAVPYLNPLKQRELGFRGMEINMIENLAVLDDIYEALDFTNNQLLKFENFPQMNRLTTILLSHNLISKIDPNIASSLPNLTTINLAHNKISTFLELVHLRDLVNLRTLIINNNPLLTMYINWKIVVLVFLPQLTMLNYQTITDEEREEAKVMKKKLKKGSTLESVLVLAPPLADEPISEENKASLGIQ